MVKTQMLLGFMKKLTHGQTMARTLIQLAERTEFEMGIVCFCFGFTGERKPMAKSSKLITSKIHCFLEINGRCAYS